MPHGARSARADQDPHKRPAPGPPAPPGWRPAAPARSRVLAGGAGRPATRGNGDPVIELDCGVTVYPAREGRDRWRVVWVEGGRRRYREAVTEAGLATFGDFLQSAHRHLDPGAITGEAQVLENLEEAVGDRYGG
jgi:hypothetical protein